MSDVDFNVAFAAAESFLLGLGAGVALYWYTDERRRGE